MFWPSSLVPTTTTTTTRRRTEQPEPSTRGLEGRTRRTWRNL